MRLDVLLVHRGLAESRQKAQTIIAAGCVRVDGKTIDKCSAQISEEADVVLAGKLPLDYVGRGGLKLQGALDAFGIDVSGWIAADIGASTGGFTDCLLKRGAAKVYAVDSGKDQLHSSLRGDARVISMEECNAKSLTADVLGEVVDVVVMDVSFTSQIPLYPAILSILKPEGCLISLIKPQFEAGRSSVGKKGIVRDRKCWENVCLSVLEQAEAIGLYARYFACSPITGGDGNTEFLACFFRNPPRTFSDEAVRRLIRSC